MKCSRSHVTACRRRPWRWSSGTGTSSAMTTLARCSSNSTTCRCGPARRPLAPEWHRLEDKRGGRDVGELMLAVWFGTQADECLPYALHADTAAIDPAAANTPAARSTRRRRCGDRSPEVFVRGRVGNQMLRTKMGRPGAAGIFKWNEVHFFVVAEPFDDELTVSVEDQAGPDQDRVIGYVNIPIATVDKRPDDRRIRPKWLDLRKPTLIDVDRLREDNDFRPSSKHLWNAKKPIGMLELGILSAVGLQPMKTARDGRPTCDAFCVAKYGRKWVRTRTVVDSLSPKFNEQYAWDVYDHATVRIRLSTIETGRVYAHAYPLLVLHPSSGVKKMGELHLAVRFTATSFASMLHAYVRPVLPKMHYTHPITQLQQENLRLQAVQILAMRLGLAEPPLRREVVEYMSEAQAHMWSMRRSKAHFYRLTEVFGGAVAAAKWLRDVCRWANPVTTVLVHLLLVILVCFPHLILPTVLLHLLAVGLWNFWYRARYPPHMNTKISHVHGVSPDDLDEEFDLFPTTQRPEVVRSRYDRLRFIAGMMQKTLGEFATQGERVQSLLSWRDPRATAIFLVFCLVTAFVFLVVPFKVLVIWLGFYWMRHPRLRHKMPSVPTNFFRRLPARTDSLL
uniref:C2 domain-containing protein n=1 Tax=Ananas comosus var. bracteatus TaxID=296719 RepID=A0A6V7NJL0_ANACO|nr:unnamed protein product [Ananas comosus var. bracteatus]